MDADTPGLGGQDCTPNHSWNRQSTGALAINTLYADKINALVHEPIEPDPMAEALENALKIRLHRAHQALRTLLTRQLSERS